MIPADKTVSQSEKLNAFYNYRAIPIKIDGVATQIAGMAHPKLQGPSLQDTLETLRPSYDVLISLEVDRTPEIKRIWEKLKGTHHTVDVPDFEAPTIRQLNQIYDIMTKAVRANQAVMVHCRGGAGRTGTILSAAVLRSMVEEGAKTDARQTVALSFPNVKTTFLVNQAIACVRGYDKKMTSVEVASQVSALESFESELSKKRRARL